MSEETMQFQEMLIRHLLAVLAERNVSFHGILSRSHNCDPTFLLDTLREMESRQMLMVSGETPSQQYVLTHRPKALPSSRHTSPKTAAHVSSFDHCRSILNSTYYGSLVDAIVRVLPPPSLTYAQWWYTEATYARLLDLVLGLCGPEDSVAFLGAPTLGALVSHFVASPVTLIDIDEVLLGRIANCCDGSPRLVHHDASNPLGAPLEAQFHVVVADPPWSPSSLKAFLIRGAELLNVDGTLIISLPPVFTRPSASADRKNLIRLASVAGLSLVAESASFTEYSVPTFEYNAYKEHGIRLDAPWRRGDVLVLRKDRPSAEFIDLPFAIDSTWDQFDYGAVRVFLKRNGASKAGPARIFPVTGKAGLMCDSTSSRSEFWKRAVLASTQGRIAEVSGRNELVAILQKLLDARLRPGHHAAKPIARLHETEKAIAMLIGDSD